MNYITLSIWHKLILICSLINGIHGYSMNMVSLVKQLNGTDEPINIQLFPENEYNITEVDDNMDFVIKLQFILNEQKIMPYLRDEIYKNHEQYNISTNNLVDLFKLREYALKDLSLKFGIPDALLNLNSFKQVLSISNLTFSQYYAEIKGNLSTAILKETLQILNIDLANFSSSITFGTEDEIFDVLSNGTYSWEKFDEVKNKTELDIPELTKNIILNHILSNSIQSLMAYFPAFPMMKAMYDHIWNQMNISTYDIYRIENLKRLVDNIHEHLVENVTFGMAISENEIVLHKNILDNLDRLKGIITIYGETSISHQIYEKLNVKIGLTDSSSILWSNNSISRRIEIMYQMVNESSSNCSYIDSDLAENNVTLINVTESGITVTVDDNVHFNLGNPLICNGKLVGLAVSQIKVANLFIFDTFFKTSEEVSNDSISLWVHSYVILFPILVHYSLF